jgi:hypothetical protein
MENLIIAILLYVAIVAIANCPNKTTATEQSAPIDYFPELEETTEPQAEPVTVAQPAIAATALSPVKIAMAQPEPVEGFRPDLSKMGVRQLYRLASDAGIKGYKKLSKAQLVEALA